MTKELGASNVGHDLIDLAHRLGEPQRELAILAEGNISARVSETRMLVKATGAALASMTPADLVDVDLAPILSLVNDETARDEHVTQTLLSSRTDPTAKQPSVEALLHAIALTGGGATFVGHTHPRAVNSILCSSRAAALTHGALFPDQIVVLGSAQILLPYVDPGLALGRAVSRELARFREAHGCNTKVIYVMNHGLFALGNSAAEVMRITEMADKVARILLGALAAGEPTYLSTEDTDRIDTRPDEIVRRRILARQSD